MVKLCDVECKFLQINGPLNSALQIATYGSDGIGIHIHRNSMADKGKYIPAEHNDTECLQVAPPFAVKRGPSDVPIQIAKGKDKVDMRHLVNIKPFRSTVRLKRQGTFRL